MLFVKELKKPLALLMLISFLPCVAIAQESEGRFARVLEGQPAPFNSWCFDDVAAAKLQTAIEFSEKRCDLSIEQAVSVVTARYSLEVQNLQLRVETIKEENEKLLLIKNEEIKKLEAAALKRPNDYSHWWAIGGFATGVLTTVITVIAIR